MYFLHRAKIGASLSADGLASLGGAILPSRKAFKDHPLQRKAHHYEAPNGIWFNTKPGGGRQHDFL
jgi:hypothetical protein